MMQIARLAGALALVFACQAYAAPDEPVMLNFVNVDIDTVVPGTVDDETGAITFAKEAGPGTYGIVDEIVVSRKAHERAVR